MTPTGPVSDVEGKVACNTGEISRNLQPVALLHPFVHAVLKMLKYRAVLMWEENTAFSYLDLSLMP